MPEPTHKRQLTLTVYATPLMTPTTELGLSIRLSMFELRETGDFDIFLGTQERARAETGGADQRVLKRREFPIKGVACIRDVGCAHLGFAPYLAHPLPKSPLRASVKMVFLVAGIGPKKTLCVYRCRKEHFVHPFSRLMLPLQTNIWIRSFVFM